MKIRLHASVKKKRKRLKSFFNFRLFCWSFLSDVVAVKGLIGWKFICWGTGAKKRVLLNTVADSTAEADDQLRLSHRSSLMRTAIIKDFVFT